MTSDQFICRSQGFINYCHLLPISKMLNSRPELGSTWSGASAPCCLAPHIEIMGYPWRSWNIVQRMPRSVDALPWICLLGFSWTFNCNVLVCQTVKTNPTRLVTIRMGKQKDTTWVWQLLKPKLHISRNHLWWPHIVGFWLSVKFQGSKTLLPYYVRTFFGHFLGYIPCSCRFRNNGNLEPIPEK